MNRWVMASVVLVVVVSFAARLSATNALPVPEVDNSAIAAGFGVLTSGVLLLRAYKRR